MKIVACVFFTCILVGIVLATNTLDGAGIAHGLCVLLAIVLLVGSRKLVSTPKNSVANTWAGACLIFCACFFLGELYWFQTFEHHDLLIRVLLSAFAYVVITKFNTATVLERKLIYSAIAISCLVAITLVWDLQRNTPKNPIPWAAGVAFMTCLLIPQSLNKTFSRSWRIAYGLATLVGLGAVLMSFSRGAYAIIFWLPFAWICLWLKQSSIYKSMLFKMLFSVSVISIAMGLTMYLKPELKAQVATQIISVIKSTGIQNSTIFERGKLGVKELLRNGEGKVADGSVEIRLGLYKLAIHEFQKSPLVGVGPDRVVQMIENEGIRLKSPAMAELDHLHNEYLQAALAYGLFGIAALATLIVGMLLTAYKVGKTDRYASWQIYGIAFMHITTGLSNVNFEHAFYSIMLMLTMGIAIVFAHSEVEQKSSLTL